MSIFSSHAGDNGNKKFKAENRSNRKLFLGVDIGGTNIKSGVIDLQGNLLASQMCKTCAELGFGTVVKNTTNLIADVLKSAGLALGDIEGIGIGVPGLVDSNSGKVIYSNNLHWNNVNLANEIKAHFNTTVKVGNDANLACLAEATFGAGKGHKNQILVTLGTGVGGGIIVDGKLLNGNMSAGAEIGHMVIVSGGKLCTCGRLGCFEAYSSATALKQLATNSAQLNPKSLMNQAVEVSAKTPFLYMESDASAKLVVDKYINYLSDGLTNLANIFRPEIILIGGGVSCEGERLIKPLQAQLNKKLYAGSYGPQVEIKTAILKNNAGFIGAGIIIKN